MAESRAWRWRRGAGLSRSGVSRGDAGAMAAGMILSGSLVNVSRCISLAHSRHPSGIRGLSAAAAAVAVAAAASGPESSDRSLTTDSLTQVAPHPPYDSSQHPQHHQPTQILVPAPQSTHSSPFSLLTSAPPAIRIPSLNFPLVANNTPTPSASSPALHLPSSKPSLRSPPPTHLP